MSVVVTGASSGIGRHLAETLAQQGHHVYATARKETDLASLSAIDGLTPIHLDVRDPSDVSELAARIEADASPLQGLIHNAGIGWLSPFAAVSDDALYDMFDVNVFGPHRLTNALLRPLLESNGRVVLIGSQGGVLSSRYFGPYCMTKHALEAYARALDEELRPHGSRAIIVQPGGIESSIAENSREETLRNFRHAPSPFAEDGVAFLEGAEDSGASGNQAGTDAPKVPGPVEPLVAETAESSKRADVDSPPDRVPSPPSIVADAVIVALFSDSPRPSYLVGTRWEGERVITRLCEQLKEAASSPSLSMNLDEVVSALRANWESGSGD